VPTFKEYINLVRSANRTVCIYPETKHPKFFNEHPTLKNAGVTIDDLVMKELREMGYNLQVMARSTTCCCLVPCMGHSVCVASANNNCKAARD
jgi:glycerophosphoryl diester phosphodiesterase